VFEEMTIIEKLQQIEPNVRRTMNGYNADIIKEAIEELKKLRVSIDRSEVRAYEVTIPGNLDSDPVQDIDLEADTQEGNEA
jgi:hypothetical protein